ncbi:helix-turn-helix domain-containing protein [Nonomuraea sp. NBC_01738]|uniref:helix-turn-helix domain-containing protein n=1 Tax=Nonomuraea sp. NBC_01738 TaxID=2976003 RepID=UPI002E0EDF0F|nr:helix-turn-helix domain-containing protein [Nonomuraea sp. NBC_01738]
MVRPPLSPEERLRGEQLGTLLRQARAERSIVEIAAAAGMSAETLRKIETGRIPTPAFFTIAALADVLGISLDTLADHASGLGARNNGWARIATSSSPGSSSR